MTRHKTIAALVAVAVAGCGQTIPQYQKQAVDQLTLNYVMAFKDAPGSKKCLEPKQLDGRVFTLCGFNEGAAILFNAGLWEIRQDGGSWVALASNGKAIAAQQQFNDPQIKPAETPPQFDVAKARALFPQ